ncbi:DUF342 domain-containing protein [Flavobacteriaceae bacterium TP-CH-4]|uniref:DUF342 domain-containing protein n=1 Tax=Pelagihabitans pacificus TaxID=2696054 RepID=A0A967AQL8_9FLAO|nr:hypothetical protein [Pelagihabitans pacificus]NHF57725.1 DUF342 domain-containing protein [Pelagihabitans pacificus]
MAQTQNHTKASKAKKIDELSLELRQWKSSFRFMRDEITFIEHLLNSYAFQPNTPNLFERLSDYLDRIKKVTIKAIDVKAAILQYEKELGGMMECMTDDCYEDYCTKHNRIKAETADCLEDFHNLKSEIFNYAGGILKRRKPDHT